MRTTLAPHSGVRALIPPLTIALTLVTACALLLAASMLAPASSGELARPAPPTAEPVMRNAEVASLARVEQVKLPPAPVVLALATLTYAPASGGPSRTLPGPLLFLVEAGALGADLQGTALLQRAEGLFVLPAGLVTLHVGDRLLVPASTAAAFHNAGAGPTLVLAAGVFPAWISAAPVTPQRLVAGATPVRWEDSWTPGATIQSLAAGWLPDAPALPATMTSRRLELAPDASASVTTHGNMALGVEAGALALSLPPGLGWGQTPSGPDVLLDNVGPATLLPDDGALLPNQADVALRNDGTGPLLILVLTVEPDTSGTLAWADRDLLGGHPRDRQTIGSRFDENRLLDGWSAAPNTPSAHHPDSAFASLPGWRRPCRTRRSTASISTTKKLARDRRCCSSRG